MADESEIKIRIKAINDASAQLKQIAADIHLIADVATKVGSGFASGTVAIKTATVATVDATKAAINLGKVQQQDAKVNTENAKTQAILSKSAMADVLAQQRVNTEAQRTNQAYWTERLNTAKNVIAVTQAAATADAKVAQANQRTSSQQAVDAERLRAIKERNAAAELKAQSQLEDAAKRTGQAHQQLAAQITKGYLQTTPAIQGIIDNLKAMGEQFVIAGAIVGSFAAILKKAFDFAEQGAQLQRLEESGTKLAASFGVSLSDAARAIKDASLGTITTQQAMLETNRALLLHVAGDTETLAKLMQIAALRGRALGLDTEAAFDRIVLGIGRVSTRILDDIGIVINGQKAYGDYAKAIGVSVDQLSDQQKRIALTNAIIEDGNKLLSATGGLINDNASAYSRLKTDITDTTNELKKLASDGITPVVIGLDAILSILTKIGPAFAQHEKDIVKTSASYADYTKELDRFVVLDVGTPLRAMGTAIGEIQKKIEGTLPFLVQFESSILSIAGGLASAFGGPLLNIFTELITKNQRLTEAQFDAAKAAEAHARAIQAETDRLQGLADAFAATQKIVDDFKTKMDALVETSDKVSFANAAQTAYDFAKATGADQQSLDALALQLGLTDKAFLKYRDTIVAASKDNKIALGELQQAFAPIAAMQLGKIQLQLGIDLGDAKRKLTEQLLELAKDATRQIEKDRLDLSRKLTDINLDEARRLADLQGDVNAKSANLAQDHDRKLENIEVDHQRQIRQIMQRYELSRLKALIDLNGKALFEAEAQRDADLANANDSAKEKKDDEQKNYDQALKDLADFQKEQEDQIAKDEDRKRDDAKIAFDRQRADAKTAYDQKKLDDQAAFNATKAQIITAYDAQRNAILLQLGIINDDNRDNLNERLQDFLDYVVSAQNILDALAAGTINPDTLRNSFIQSGGIPFGGIPYVPPVTPPPPPTNICPDGCHWNGVKCVMDSDETKNCGSAAVGPTGLSNPTGTNSTNIKVTLNVTGDGIMAQAVRTAALNAFVDVMRE